MRSSTPVNPLCESLRLSLRSSCWLASRIYCHSNGLQISVCLRPVGCPSPPNRSFPTPTWKKVPSPPPPSRQKENSGTLFQDPPFMDSARRKHEKNRNMLDVSRF